jgi:hypothetical protein
MLCCLLYLTWHVVTKCVQVVVDKASGGEQAMLADLAPGSTVEVSPAGGSQSSGRLVDWVLQRTACCFCCICSKFILLDRLDDVGSNSRSKGRHVRMPGLHHNRLHMGTV